MRKVHGKTFKGQLAPRPRTDLRPLVWAALSLTAYLVTFVIAVSLGVPGPLPFVYGGLAMLGVMLSEACLRGKLWLFEPAFSRTFGHPEIAHRLTFFSMGLLLVLETSIILGFLLAN